MIQQKTECERKGGHRYVTTPINQHFREAKCIRRGCGYSTTLKNK